MTNNPRDPVEVCHGEVGVGSAVAADPPPPMKARQILLATTYDAIQLGKRGFEKRVDDVAGNGRAGPYRR